MAEWTLLKFDVSVTRMKLTYRNVLTSGLVGANAEFNFSDEWKGLTKVAVFQAGGVIKSMLVQDDGVCQIPQEVLVNKGLDISVAVQGTLNTTIVIPTIYVDCGCILKGADPEGDPSVPPTPTLYQQILAEFEKYNAEGKQQVIDATNQANIATQQAQISTAQAVISTDASLVSTDNSYKTAQDAQETENDKQQTILAKNEAIQAKNDAQSLVNNFNQQLGQANGIATLDANSRVVQDVNNALKLGGTPAIDYATKDYVDTHDVIVENNANQFTTDSIAQHNTSNVAHQDIRNEVALKANSNDVYTKQQSDDLYARKLVYQRLYISNQGILATPPTTPADGVQFTLSSTTTVYQTLFDVQRVSTTDVVLSNENAFIQDYSMAFNRVGTVALKLTIYTATQTLGTYTTGAIAFVGNSNFPVINLPQISVILNGIADGALVTIHTGEIYSIKCEVAFNSADAVTAKLLCLKDSYVSTTQNAQQSVSINTDNIADGAITTDKIADGAVTNDKIDNVNANKIIGSVVNATNSVDAQNVTTNINNIPITNIFESNGTIVKNATNSANAINAATAQNAIKLGNKTEAQLNVLTATKLATPRTISISGVSSGSADFDGSVNIDITLDHNYIPPVILTDEATVQWNASQTNYTVVTLTAERNINITNIVAGFYGICHSYGNGFNLTQLATDGWYVDPSAQYLTLTSVNSMYVHTFSYDGVRKTYSRTVVE